MKIYKSLNNKGSLIDIDAKVTILYSQYGRMFLYTMDRYYKSNFRGSETCCYKDCSIYHECVGGSHALCIKVYDFMNKRRGPKLYFTEIKMTLFLSRIFISNIR